MNHLHFDRLNRGRDGLSSARTVSAIVMSRANNRIDISACTMSPQTFRRIGKSIRMSILAVHFSCLAKTIFLLPLGFGFGKLDRIVTGVQISKRNRMIQFLIAESKLLPYGKLNTTITHETGEVNANNRYVGHPEFSIDSKGVQSGIDFHTLTYEKRSINLDTVLAPAGKLVTGVRFHALDDGTLTIQIRCTDFDYEAGN